MRAKLVILAVVAAALPLIHGCAGTVAPEREVVVQTRTVEVKIPMRVPCVAAADVPAVPGTAMRRDGDLRQLAAGAATDVYALAEYAARADALLRSCASP
ncbi:MAG: hypothetical protein IT519_16750 [Burkholderiales bacterium]|nr:hypothetical protein [Burkholderiales bacterium]